MKKLIKTISAFACSACLALVSSCSGEVSSITVTVDGEEFVVDKNTDYLEVLGITTFVNIETMMIEIDSKIQTQGGPEEIVKGTLYIKPEIKFYDVEVSSENDTALISEYQENILDSNDSKIGHEIFNRYQNSNELAFGGQSYISAKDNAQNIIYSNDDYPNQTQPGTLLNEQYVMYSRLKQAIKDLRVFVFYRDYKFRVDNQWVEYDLEDYVEGSYKLYKDYILCEHTTPFPVDPAFGPEMMRYNHIKSSLDNGYTFKQTSKYNYHTHTFDYIKYEGNALLTVGAATPTKFEIELTFKQFDETKFTNSSNSLITYVKNSSK